MPRVVALPDFVIANGQQDSNVLSRDMIDDADMLNIWAPATLSGTITVETEPTDSGTAFETQQSGATDIAIPAAKATPITDLAWKQMRLHSSVAEGATRTFPVNKRTQIYG